MTADAPKAVIAFGMAQNIECAGCYFDPASAAGLRPGTVLVDAGAAHGLPVLSLIHALAVEFVEQELRLVQIGRVEALGEPAVDPCE